MIDDTSETTNERTTANKTDNDELIAYCGLYCGECFAHLGRIAELSKELRKELRGARFDKIAEGIPFAAFKNYDKCYEVLGALVKLRCRSGCRSGGGNPFCAIRKCANGKELEGCWECGDFRDCRKLDFLRTGHGDAHVKNLRKIGRSGKEEFLKGRKHWYSKPKK